MERDENSRNINFKLVNINNDIKIIKDTLFDMKVEMNEMKKLIEEYIIKPKKEKLEKNYWFYK